MTCPTIDKLSQYADGLLTGQELVEIRKHIESCEECQQIVDVFKGEEEFIKETLETPVLPDEFTERVLDQLEPYKPKEKRRDPWKRVMLAAAGMTLAVGLSAALNPSFAAWVGGLFTTEQVDEGLRMATDAGLAERVNYEITDKGITLKVEDIIADSSRIALSYQIVNKNGKVQKITQELGDLETEILVTDQNGVLLDNVSKSWIPFTEYGLFEFSLRDQDALEKITIHFNIAEINGVKGSWKLDVPVELKESNALTTTLSLDDVKTSAHGVNVNLKEMKFAPSAHELFYETSFTDEMRQDIEREVRSLEEKHGEEIMHGFAGYGNEIQYHLENDNNEVIFRNHALNGEKEQSRHSWLLQGVGQGMGQLGHVAWNDSFTPRKDDEQLTFVLDGIIKTVPADFSITVKPKELKKQPVTFEYEGNSMKIKKIEKQSDYYFRKSLLPIGKINFITIKMEGGEENFLSGLGTWILVDDKGNSYDVFNSGSTLDRTLTAYVDKIPEEFTLHLLSVTHYEELEEKWEVPLHK